MKLYLTIIVSYSIFLGIDHFHMVKEAYFAHRHNHIGGALAIRRSVETSAVSLLGTNNTRKGQ